jgi:hypothetical protein
MIRLVFSGTVMLSDYNQNQNQFIQLFIVVSIAILAF